MMRASKSGVATNTAIVRSYWYEHPIDNEHSGKAYLSNAVRCSGPMPRLRCEPHGKDGGRMGA